MTGKELFYVEDALGHEQFFKQKCAEIAVQLQDSELKKCVQDMIAKHDTIFRQFFGLL